MRLRMRLRGWPGTAAARLVGMDRQALRDAVVRYNAEGVEGLRDRPRGHPRLTADEEAALAAVIIAGPDPERDGVCAWTRADLCRWLPICAGGCRSVPVAADLCRWLPICAGGCRSVPVAADLCRWLEGRFAKTYHPSSMTRVLRRMGFSRQKARPAHRQRDAEAQERFKKRGLHDVQRATAAAHAGQAPTALVSG